MYKLYIIMKKEAVFLRFTVQCCPSWCYCRVCVGLRCIRSVVSGQSRLLGLIPMSRSVDQFVSQCLIFHSTGLFKGKLFVLFVGIPEVLKTIFSLHLKFAEKCSFSEMESFSFFFSLCPDFMLQKYSNTRLWHFC